MTMVANKRPRMDRSTALKASSGEMTPNNTMRAAPTSDPAVRPIGRRGKDGNTASSHHIPKAMHPLMTLSSGAHVNIAICSTRFSCGLGFRVSEYSNSTKFWDLHFLFVWAIHD